MPPFQAHKHSDKAIQRLSWYPRSTTRALRKKESITKPSCQLISTTQLAHHLHGHSHAPLLY
jgi:hypothetical protein